jgi:hypothetical protein
MPLYGHLAGAVNFTPTAFRRPRAACLHGMRQCNMHHCGVSVRPARFGRYFAIGGNLIAVFIALGSRIERVFMELVSDVDDHHYENETFQQHAGAAETEPDQARQSRGVA